jgi:MOFRL family/Domain of unknown function (DUF4147)
VVGDALDVIASGPTTPDVSTFAEALDILDRFGLRERAPQSIVLRLEQGAHGELPETPKPGDPLFARVRNSVIGNNALVVDAAAARARELGFTPHVLTRALEGEARDMAGRFVEMARAIQAGRGPVAAPACVMAGGETTVTIKGRGKGGRCQEFALTAALAMDGLSDVVVLAAGTDGSDGPTEAAGAIVDRESVARARARGFDPEAGLAETSWSPVPPIPTCWTSTWSWCANRACPRARRCASVRADATPETDARPVTSKRWHGGVTVLAAIAIILVLTNIVLFERNRSLQAEVSARAQYIQQTTQLEVLNREIVNAIANLAVRNKDDALRTLLAQQGISINMGAGQGGPPPAGQSPEGRR